MADTAESLLQDALAALRAYKRAGAKSEGAHFWEDYDQAGIRAEDILKRARNLKRRMQTSGLIPKDG